MSLNGEHATFGFSGIVILCGLVCTATLCKVTSGFGFCIWLSIVALHQSVCRRDWRPLLMAAIPGCCALVVVLILFSSPGRTMPRSLYGITMSLIRFGFVRNVGLFILPALCILLAQAIGIRRELMSQAFRRLRSVRGGVTVAFTLLFVIVPLPAVLISFTDDEKYFFWTPILMAGPVCAAALGAIWKTLPAAHQILLKAAGFLCFAGLLANEGLDFISQERRHFSSSGSVENAIRGKFLSALLQLDKQLSPQQKKVSCLFIPPRVRDQLLDTHSLSDLFLPGTLTGIAQVYGQASSSSPLSNMVAFSMSLYKPFAAKDATDEAARDRGKALGFERLFRVRIDDGQIVIDELMLSPAPN